MIRKLKNLAHLMLAILANVIYGFPGKKIKVIGVTGTDGKTTTTSLIYQILNSAGHKTAMITTVGAYINGQMRETGFHVTTPSAFALQKFLKEAVQTGHEFAIIETSSHGIDQNRIWGIPYKVAVITNITHEHLDYHKDFETYAQTKFKFMKSAPIAVVNIDDSKITSLKEYLKGRIVTYSKNNSADYNLTNFPFETSLFGSFNQMNCLAAIAVCKQFNLMDDEIRAGLKQVKSPTGRQDIVYNKHFKVMVDFAHTPNAISNILKEVRNTNPARIIHLFGAPGRRDVSKRPLMGQASAENADIIVLTADDPRDEKVEDINTRVKEGISKKFEINKNFFEIPDRLDAIKYAINLAQPGDFIVLTGKGHETTLATAKGEIPWDDKKIALEVIQALGK